MAAALAPICSMSPVQPTSGHATRALLIAVGTAAAVVLVLWGASVVLTHRHNTGRHSGTVGGEVTLGSASKLANEVAGRGPIFYPDVSGNDLRNLFVQHSGTDPKQGWVAFLVQVPGERRGCVWEWQPRSRDFVASCDATRRLPGNALGVPHIPTRVTHNDRLVVDLTTTPGNG